MTDSEILKEVGAYSFLYEADRTLMLEAMAQVRKAERDRCAKILNDRAKQCAAAADQSDDEKYRIDLRSWAWTFSVIEQEILNEH